MDWRLVVKVLAAATQVLTAGWFFMMVGEREITGDAAVFLSVGMLSILVLVLNLAKSLRSGDTELATLEKELEKAELGLKLHRLKAQSQQES